VVEVKIGIFPEFGPALLLREAFGDAAEMLAQLRVFFFELPGFQPFGVKRLMRNGALPHFPGIFGRRRRFRRFGNKLCRRFGHGFAVPVRHDGVQIFHVSWVPLCVEGMHVRPISPGGRVCPLKAGIALPCFTRGLRDRP
jgi:hypothetical protein